MPYINAANHATGSPNWAQVKYRGHLREIDICMPVYETIRRIGETRAMVEDGLETVIKRTDIACRS